MVGSANGRSIRELTKFLPGNSSRTSTQAIRTPMTASIAATTIETIKVKRMAASACLLVMASTNSETPPSKLRATTAASGIRTISVSQATLKPPMTAGPVRMRCRRPAGRDGAPAVVARAPSAAAISDASLGGADTEVLLDLRHGALVRVEELVVDLVPAAELVDLEEVLGVGVRLLVDEARRDAPVALRGEDLLRLVGLEEIQERLRLVGGLGLGRDRGRVLDQDRLVRDHVVELDARLLRRDGLVLVGDQDVALAAGEGRERLARGLVLDRRVLEDLLEEVQRLLRGLALLDLGAVGGHEVPLRAAGRERVRRDDLDAVLDDVVPALDVLGVA